MGLLGLLPLAGGVISAIAGAGKQNKADKATDEAMRLTREDYEGRQPLRDRFQQGALAPMGQMPDLSSVFSDPGNPFNRQAPPPPMSGPLYESMPGRAAPPGLAGGMPPGLGTAPGLNADGRGPGPAGSVIPGAVGNGRANAASGPAGTHSSGMVGQSGVGGVNPWGFTPSGVMPPMPSSVMGGVQGAVSRARPQSFLPPFGG